MDLNGLVMITAHIKFPNGNWNTFTSPSLSGLRAKIRKHSREFENQRTPSFRVTQYSESMRECITSEKTRELAAIAFVLGSGEYLERPQ